MIVSRLRCDVTVTQSFPTCDSVRENRAYGSVAASIGRHCNALEAGWSQKVHGPRWAVQFTEWAGPQLTVYYSVPPKATADSPILIIIPGVKAQCGRISKRLGSPGHGKSIYHARRRGHEEFIPNGIRVQLGRSDQCAARCSRRIVGCSPHSIRYSMIQETIWISSGKIRAVWSFGRRRFCAPLLAAQATGEGGSRSCSQPRFLYHARPG